jgi:hypothetical protein
MRYSFARIRGLGYILWHARHEFYHTLLGITWAWFLRERWHEFNASYLSLAIFGSLLPDLEHLYYFFTYGRTDFYTREVIKTLKKRQWRFLTVLIEQGHKQNTELAFHNLYIILILTLAAIVSLIFDRRNWVVLFGAMIIHYIFDIFDDIMTLGYINPNWKRWGRPKKHKKQVILKEVVNQ